MVLGGCSTPQGLKLFPRLSLFGLLGCNLLPCQVLLGGIATLGALLGVLSLVGHSLWGCAWAQNYILPFHPMYITSPGETHSCLTHFPVGWHEYSVTGARPALCHKYCKSPGD